jgi:ubiquinone/menaquinone biosynthesis C-methylase UbiE
LVSPLRRLLQNPDTILAGFVSPGMTVLEVGPAMGFFSLPLARLVGPAGRIVCVDVQERMLQTLVKRARLAGQADRIVARVCGPTSLGLDDFTEGIDFALAFAVVHEMPDPPRFFAELARLLRAGARCLVAEPKGHVTAPAFEATLATARQVGLGLVGRPVIWRCRAAVLQKGEAADRRAAPGSYSAFKPAEFPRPLV